MNFYGHRNITRRVLVSFLDFLSSFTVEKYRYDSNTGEFQSRKFVRVPVQYASRDAWLQVVRSASARKSYDPGVDNRIEVEWVLPRISANVTGFTYDTQRKISKQNRIPDMRYELTDKLNTYMPVPYNLDVEVTAIARTMDDVLQITEQMLPFFSPSMSIDVNVLPDQASESIPIVLQSCSPDFPDEVSEDEIRLFQMVFSFQLRMNYYLPKRVDPFVKSIETNFLDRESELKFSQYIQTAELAVPIGQYEDRSDTLLNPVTTETR